MRVRHFFRTHWRWGPLAFGASTGLSALPWITLLGVGLILGGLLTSVALVVGPAVANAVSNGIVGRAHRRQGLPWPPPAPGEASPADYRQAFHEIAVELESNANLLQEKVEENKVWNSANRPLAATAYSRHATTLSRSRQYGPLYQGLSTIYNDFNSRNYAVKRHFGAALNRKRPSEFEADELEAMAGLAKQAAEMRELLVDGLDEL